MTYARSGAPESGAGDGDGDEEEEETDTTMLHRLCEIEKMGLDGRAVRECWPGLLKDAGHGHAATGAREDERSERGEERSEVRVRGEARLREWRRRPREARAAWRRRRRK